MGIDYGTKRTGIAVTDPLQIIASNLETVPTANLYPWLKAYFESEIVEKIIVGEPLHLDGNPAQIAPLVYTFVKKLKKLYPDKEVILQDERFTSKEAERIIIRSGIKKMKRRDKSLVDKISAALILESYMKEHVW